MLGNCSACQCLNAKYIIYSSKMNVAVIFRQLKHCLLNYPKLSKEMLRKN